jgi:hypothetical protein
MANAACSPAARVAVLRRRCAASPGGSGLALTAQTVPPFGECAARALTLPLRCERGGEIGMDQQGAITLLFCALRCPQVWYVQNATKGENAVTTR